MNQNSPFWGLTSAVKWLFYRLPRPFSLTFLLISLWWAFNGFEYADRYIAEPAQNIASRLLDQLPASWLNSFVFTRLVHVSNIDRLIFATTTLLSFVLGFLVAYNVSALINFLVFKLAPRSLKFHAGFVPVPFAKGSPIAPFSESTRIGIVLAGGGAKGAYQAGAMKAIYEFLERHNALNNVKVISGTSVGSWNAMFWLAGMIKSPKGWTEPGCHEWWWKRLTARHLVAPRFFVPSLQNAFLSCDPWQGQFDKIFGSDDVKRRLFETDIHFYMTRSNVRSGGLECATNNPKPRAVNRVKFDRLGSSNTPDEFFDRMKTAVFASMDLPPLFPYIKSNDELYEDGGVIDNLPLSFPAAENCDLIFILPLNSDFEQEPNNRSLIARISRVMDVQQGALERHGFKLLYLYNENAALRNRIKELSLDEGKQEAEIGQEQEAVGRLQPLKYAMQRKNQEIRIFAVCPEKSFVQTTINTRDLWNTWGARVAFDVMYSTTSELLEAFDFAESQKVAHVALIKRAGTYTFDHDF